MAKNKKRDKKTASKNIVLFIFAILLVAAITLGIIILIKQANSDKSSEKDSIQNRNTADTILQSEEDLKDEDKVAESSNNAKDRMEADEKAKADTTIEVDDSGLKIAKPVLNFVSLEGDKIVAGGAVPNVNETGGKCLYSFSKNGVSMEFSADPLPNPSYISCETVRVDKAKFTNGTWTVKIKYKSNAAEGESETQTIQIQ